MKFLWLGSLLLIVVVSSQESQEAAEYGVHSFADKVVEKCYDLYEYERSTLDDIASTRNNITTEASNWLAWLHRYIQLEADNRTPHCDVRRISRLEAVDNSIRMANTCYRNIRDNIDQHVTDFENIKQRAIDEIVDIGGGDSRCVVGLGGRPVLDTIASSCYDQFVQRLEHVKGAALLRLSQLIPELDNLSLTAVTAFSSCMEGTGARYYINLVQNFTYRIC